MTDRTMAHRTVVLNVVGLTRGLIGSRTDTRTPAIDAFVRRGRLANIRSALPAVTTTAQSNYLTGRPPSAHGIVGNGWFDRQLAEVQFWKQSNHLVTAPKVWESLRTELPGFTCAKLFWWYNMYSTADYSITPRPLYPADGRKVFDIHTWPYSIRHEIKADLGEFPFFGFWGPAAGVRTPQGEADSATRWIAESAKWIERRHQPTLSLVYLPHLDYNLQRFGPDTPRIDSDLEQIDSIVGDLIRFFDSRSVRVLILSEYGITPVNTPIHLNRLFREKGWITVKDELGLEVLDPGASRAFAVADHQIAHVHVNDPGIAHEVRNLLDNTPGISRVLDASGKAEAGLDHSRSGDFVALADENAWFTYYYWTDDSRAPDFARCVDIHRKPGYDPVELFLDPKRRFVRSAILWRLLKKKFGFRMLMDVIPLDASLVRGSHGVRTASLDDAPVAITDAIDPGKPVLDSLEIRDLIARMLMD